MVVHLLSRSWVCTLLFQAFRQPVVAVPAEMQPIKRIHALRLFPAAAALILGHGRKEQIGGTERGRGVCAAGAVKAPTAQQIIGKTGVFRQERSLPCVWFVYLYGS